MSIFNTLLFKEVGNESHHERGERKTDRVDNVAVHRAVNGRGGGRIPTALNARLSISCPLLSPL